MSLTRIKKTGEPQVIPASDGPAHHLRPHPNQAAQRAEGRYSAKPGNDAPRPSNLGRSCAPR
jgi:hypothetical protein